MIFGLILVAAMTPALQKYRSVCDQNGTTQAAMTACADHDLTRQKARLGTAYRRLLQSTANPTALRNIRTAEAAWESYRDAYIRAAYPLPNKQEAYGTSYPMSVDYLQIEMIQRQIAALNTLADLHKHK